MSSDSSACSQNVHTPASPAEFHEVGNVAAISAGTGISVTINGQELAIFNLNGEVHAVSNHCPHRGAPLHDGYVKGDVVLCNWHCFDFNLKTGVCETVPELRLPTYEVRVADGKIFVRC